MKKQEASIEITDAFPEDAEELLRVNKETWLATYPNEKFGISREDILAKFDGVKLEKWKKILNEKDGPSHYWAAKYSGNIIGYASAKKENGKHELASIYILPEYQGIKIGRKLAEKVFSWLGNEKNIFVNVASYNEKAIEFYRRLGFEFAGKDKTTPAARLPNGKIIPEITLIKKPYSGFTLIELLVTIGIIGLLAGFTIVALGPVRAKARDTKRKAELGQIGRFLSASNCYTPSAGPGDYDLADLHNEVKSKFPQAAMFSLPKDPKTGSNTRTNYRYAYQDESKCILYTNLENDKEPVSLNISSPTPGYGTGILRSNAEGPNGSRIYYQIGK